MWVYIVECSDKSLYTGWTNDIVRRLKSHNTGKGAKYTRSRKPVRLVYTEQVESRGAALVREAQIKRLNRREKCLLVSHSKGSAVKESFSCINPSS
ncbi:GIY-YIG domain-containing protein [Spirochaetia bacterium]|nr:GIY-YIG domain-containing protein [Spirochaetia bacterium]